MSRYADARTCAAAVTAARFAGGVIEPPSALANLIVGRIFKVGDALLICQCSRNIWTAILPYGLQRHNENRTKERVMRFGIFGAAAAFVLAIATAPSMAQPRQPMNEAQPLPSISTYCATIEPGNPFSKVYDYQAWSAFRSRGTWDNRGSDACAKNPRYSPPGTAPFRPDPYPNPSWF